MPHPTKLPHRGQAPLKVLLLCTADQGGGAAEACRRLLDALGAIGVEARLLVLHKGTDDDRIASVARTPLGRLWGRFAFVGERLEIYLRNGRDRSRLFRVSTARLGFDLSEHPWVREADVLHLHWINQGLLSLDALRRLSKLGKPIFSTLHDLWAATGICHLPLEFSPQGSSLCPRYEAGCGLCPLLGGKKQEDLSRSVWRQKAFLADPPFSYIAVSRSEARLFERSPLMRSYGAPSVLPNPIDLGLFSPETAEGMPIPDWWQEGRIYLTLVAARLDDDVKGPHLLMAIARELQERYPELASRITLVLVGAIRREGYFDELALPYVALGSVRDHRQLARIYSLSRALLSTSIYETFGQTLVEALAVGTPVVSFRCGGPEDIILGGTNGFLVPAFETATYADRLAQLLTTEVKAGEAFSAEVCRRSAERFGAEAVARELYERYQASLTAPSSRS